MATQEALLVRSPRIPPILLSAISSPSQRRNMEAEAATLVPAGTLAGVYAGGHFGWLHCCTSGSESTLSGVRNPECPLFRILRLICRRNHGISPRRSACRPFRGFRQRFSWSPPLFSTPPDSRPSFLSYSVRPHPGFFFNRSFLALTFGRDRSKFDVIACEYRPISPYPIRPISNLLTVSRT